MILKDVYRVIIRVFALFLLITSAYIILAAIPNLYFFDNDLKALSVIVVTAATLIGLFLGLVFKTDNIIRFLKLDKDQSEEEVKITNITDISIIKMSILILSIYFFMLYIPTFIYQSVLYFNDETARGGGLNELIDIYGGGNLFSLYDWVLSLIYVIGSYLIFSNYKGIAKFLNQKVVEKSEVLDDVV